MLLTLDEEGLDEELLLTLEEDLELLEEPTELLLLVVLLGEKEDLELLVFELEILELLLVLDGAEELLVVVLADDLTVREEGAAVLLRTDDVDTPLAEVDLTFALVVLVFLTPEFDLVIAPVLLELFTLLTLLNVFAALLSLALFTAVNPYGGQP